MNASSAFFLPPRARFELIARSQLCSLPHFILRFVKEMLIGSQFKLRCRRVHRSLSYQSSLSLSIQGCHTRSRTDHPSNVSLTSYSTACCSNSQGSCISRNWLTKGAKVFSCRWKLKIISWDLRPSGSQMRETSSPGCYSCHEMAGYCPRTGTCPHSHRQTSSSSWVGRIKVAVSH